MAEHDRTLARRHCLTAMGAVVCLVLTLAVPLPGRGSPISILDRVERTQPRPKKSAPTLGALGQPNPLTVPRVVLPDDSPGNAPLSSRTDQLLLPPGAMLSAQPTRSWADEMARSDLSRGAALPPAWTPLGAPSESPPDEQSSGSSLRDVLRSIITWHDEGGARSGERGEPSSRPSDTGGSIDLRELVLDSEIGGAVLRAIVNVTPSQGDGSTFAIFGFGKFTLDLTPNLHSALVSELSSGTSFGLSLNGDWLTNTSYLVAANNANNSPSEPHERINLVRLVWHWILDFIDSPIGALLSMSAVISILLWIGVKSVVFLQRRTSRNGPF